MTTYVSNWIFLGNFAELDTNDSNVGVEGAGSLVGTTFSTANTPDMQFLEATYSEPDNDNGFETNDVGQTGDLVSYDSGSGPQSSIMDAHWDYSANILLANGSTVTRNLGMVQLENGDLFINGDSLNNLDIVSITPTSVSASGYASFFGQRQISNSSIVCFASGTLIACEDGPIEVQRLRVGSQVITVDHGPQQVRWVGCRRITAADMAANSALRPVRIRASALGCGLPERDLFVSQQHRILVRSKIAGRMIGSHEVLIPAKQLIGVEGIDYADDLCEVVYVHFLCSQHEVVFAEGAQTETLFPGPQALKTLNAGALKEILAIFPDLATASYDVLESPARPLVKGHLARKIAARHKANDRKLFVGSRAGQPSSA